MKISLSSKNILKTLIVSFILYQTYIQNKVISIPGLIPVLAGLIGVFLLINIFGKRNKDRIRLPSEIRFFVAYLMVMLPMGLINSPNPAAHFARCVDMFAYTLIMVALIYICQQDKSYVFIFKTMIVNAVILSIAFTINPVLLPSGRYSLTLDVNPNALAMSMTAGICCCICLLRQKKIARLFAIIICMLFIYSIFLAASLKNLASLIVFLVVEYIVSIRSSIKEKKGTALIFIIDIIVVSMTIVSAFVLLSGDTNLSKTIVGSRINELLAGTASLERLRLYERGITLFKANWLCGLGFDGFEYFYATYSHSTLVEVFVSGGIIGGVFYCMGYISILFKCIKQFCRDRKIRKSMRTLSGESISFMALLTALVFVIIHPYEMTSYICFALVITTKSVIETQNAIIQE